MTITETLLSMRDEDYARFQLNLMPTVPPEAVIGVRTPQLRDYAKKIAGTPEANEFLTSLPHTYYDENNLHGILLEYIKDFDEALAAVEAFLPYIDNWATCDIFSPKALLKQPDRLLERIRVWLTSPHAYTVRFGLVRLSGWYLDAPRFSGEILSLAASASHDDYYVGMAQAWLFCTALAKQYRSALPYLTRRRLPVWLHNKVIQKTQESDRISPDTKAYLKRLKRRIDEPIRRKHP